MSSIVTDVQPDTARADATGALLRAREHLLGKQTAQGWWKGELRTNVTMDAEDLLLREFLGVRTTEQTEHSARWIRSHQSAEGTWANFPGGPPDLSTTIEAYVALRLAGDAPDAPHMRAARRFVEQRGGRANARIFTKFWLAMFGEWSWDELPVMPPEIIFLPSWAPLNVYDWACWARQTVVALTVVSALRPVRTLSVDIGELPVGTEPAKGLPLSARRLVGTAFHGVDWVLHRHENLPVKPLRSAALRRAAEWIVARQEADGGWGGIQPPWVYSIIALYALGYPLDHPVLAAALRGLDGFTITADTPEGPVRWLEACQSPVWDTALALNALFDAGIDGHHPAALSATDWLLGEQITVPGDWSVRRPGVAPGGWSFEFANDNYPDTDDTAEIVLALRRVRHPNPGPLHAAVDRAVGWLSGMRSADGGWGAFDADNTSRVAEYLPFSDFGAVIDPPSADVTAHIVEMYGALGRADSAPARGGVRWLLRHQETDGSWFGRWGANHVYGTGAVVPALVAAGIDPADRRIRKAVDWLVSVQNADGGWGEDLRSYVDDGWRGRGESTASQTAWALLALLAAGERGQATEAGIRWLVDAQNADGSWDEEMFTGTGFPGDFYISYALYRMVFPINALGRYLGTDRGEALP